MSVSGFPHSGQNTNSSAYSFIFWFIFCADVFAPSTSLPERMSPGVASSLNKYFSMCSGCLLSVDVIVVKFVIIVFAPSMCPTTFGISNLSFS